MTQRFALLALIAGLVSACSWKRFDEITTSPPVRIVEGPSKFSGTGRSISTFRDKDNAPLVVATALDGYAIFDLSLSGNDPIDQIDCLRADSCFIAERTATIRRESDGETLACVAHGLDVGTSGKPTVSLYCDGKNLSLTLSEDITSRLGTLSKSSQLGLYFASSPRGSERRLLMSETHSQSLVYFPATAATGALLALPASVSETFGQSLALLDTRFDADEAGATLVVGDPDNATVHLYAVDEAGTVATMACLKGPSAFGTLLATGYFASDELQGLAIATLDQVTVLPDLEELATAAAATSGCVALDDLSQAKSLHCSQFGLGSACLDTGALAAANIDGNAPDELLVGAPTAAASGEDASGLVLTLSLLDDELQVHDQFTPSSAESDDRLGQSVLGVSIGGRDVVLAGAPGGNKLAAFYCSSLLAEGEGGKRCE